MDWDYSFFIPKNNPFLKEKTDPNPSEAALIVNEINRVLLCADCGKRVGDVSSRLYEIDEKVYCASCGPQHIAKTP